MRNGRILKKGGFFVIVLIMILSTATGAMVENKPHDLTSEIFTKNNGSYAIANNKGYMIWDNQMSYNDLLQAEEDKINQVDAYPADDFTFEIDTVVTEVLWVGGYSDVGYDTTHWNWTIAFYEDDGTGSKPGELYAGNYVFNKDNYKEKLIEEEPEWAIYYEIFVTLPENITFKAGEKYWISIWAVAKELPIAGWGYHVVPITLESAVFKSLYIFNDTEWHSTAEVLGGHVDMCFQLNSVDNIPPIVEIIKPAKAVYFRDKYLFPRFIRITQIIGTITVSVNATDDQTGVNRVEFFYGLLGRKQFDNISTAPYNATWKMNRPRFIHIHILKVVAYDNAGNSATDRMIVRKIL